MATYAIGDLQGCLDPLRQLLGEIGFSASRDRLWFVGDLVNRGPQSLDIRRFVKDLSERAIVVQGTHDLHLLMVAEGYGKRHTEDTLDPILAAPDRDELLKWMRTRPLLHVEDEYAMVHAGWLPRWSVQQAGEVAGETEAVLRADNYREFLAHMYGNEPASWDDSLAGWDRLRVVINAMTRMRFCTPEGRMDLKVKGPVDRAPPGYMPWFEVPGRKSRTHTVIFGHWSALGLKITSNLLALDSGCLWGGALTAVRLEDRRSEE